MANKETSHPSRANKSSGLRKTIRPLLPPLLDIVIVFPLCVYDSLVTSMVVNSLDMLLLLLLAQLKSSLQIMLTMLVSQNNLPCILNTFQPILQLFLCTKVWRVCYIQGKLPKQSWIRIYRYISGLKCSIRISRFLLTVKLNLLQYFINDNHYRKDNK